jgi:two-component system, chemotaxis family, chemotaxis protein CheY
MNKHRILVVDDSLVMRTMLRNILSEAGYNVVGEARNAEMALAMIKEKNPDIITLDYILPESSGIDLLKTLKVENSTVKVVMISAVGQERIINEALNNGASAYIFKPFEKEKVLKIIENLIK